MVWWFVLHDFSLPVGLAVCLLVYICMCACVCISMRTVAVDLALGGMALRVLEVT